MEPIKVDFKKLRIDRQKDNNLEVLKCIKNNKIKEFYKIINKKELDRILIDLEIEFEELWNKLMDDVLFSRLLVRQISKKASRQGYRDEKYQIEICNNISSKLNIHIEQLGPTDIIPTKDGKIMTKKEIKENKITKDCCLKAFDGKISGKIDGYLTAKVSFGSGGHQDNVFEEMDTIAKWWNKYRLDYLFILFDTDLENKLNRLKIKYKDCNNIKIFNHYELQKYLIDEYNI